MTEQCAALVGSTGLVGSQLLKQLLATPAFTNVHSISRRAPSVTGTSTFKAHVDKDTSAWPAALKASTPPPAVFFSALGTTRAQAGGLEKQRAIDLDLNKDLAQAAREAGTNVYVLISTHGANATSIAPYLKMKGQLDDAVSKMGFEHTVILRPGALLGQREAPPLAVRGLNGAAKLLGSVSKAYLVDAWAIDADVVAGAAIVAAQKCLEGEREKGVWILSQKEVLGLGKPAQ
ncbi:hypothetical protein LTR85_002623 [Meristemomyces frigidus]|nr:hypothetical protein LTR85_002623 [Meristemomyces frigidus]